MYDLQFDPKTEEELHDFLEVGDGNFEVFKATRKEAQSTGNPMIELVLKVWDKNGENKLIYDNLMLLSNKFALRRIRHFCYSCGLGDFYEAGKLNATDCIGKQGKLKIGFKPEAHSKDGRLYKAKNVVDDYEIEVSCASNEPKKQNSSFTSAQDEKFDDDIPF
jgi:hypothetical protein